jgi:hypothetical protein
VPFRDVNASEAPVRSCRIKLARYEVKITELFPGRQCCSRDFDRWEVNF